MLTAPQLQQIGHLLADMAKEIPDKARESLRFAKDRVPDVVGRDSLDESTQEEHHSTQMSFHEREMVQANAVEAALLRLTSGTIDECEDCGESIGFARLRVAPTATRCVTCQTEAELPDTDYASD